MITMAERMTTAEAFRCRGDARCPCVTCEHLARHPLVHEPTSSDALNLDALLEGLTRGMPPAFAAAYRARLSSAEGRALLAGSEAEAMRRALAGGATMPQHLAAALLTRRTAPGSAYAPSHACLDVDYGDDDSHLDLFGGDSDPDGDERDLPRQRTRYTPDEEVWEARLALQEGDASPVRVMRPLADGQTVWLRHKGSHVATPERRTARTVREQRRGTRAASARTRDSRADRVARMEAMLAAEEAKVTARRTAGVHDWLASE